MNRTAQCEMKLRELLVDGVLPASVCGSGLRRVVAPLIAGGVLAWQPSGAGRRLVVSNPERFAEFIAATYPHAANEITTLPSARVSAVARFRDSKALANDMAEIVNLRAWSAGGLRSAGSPIPVDVHTARFGVFSFLLDARIPNTLHEPCALVENPAVFTAFERLELSTKIVFFGRGCVSERLLAWFASQTDPSFSLLHLPDYDPVGLSEFERLSARLGPRIQLHLPEDLPKRFARYSNRELLNKPNSQAMLARLRNSKSPEVLRIVALIDRYNAGLEQEALLL